MGEAVGVGSALKSFADLLGTHPGYLGIAILLLTAAPLADRYIVRRKRIRYRVLYNSKLGLSPVELRDGNPPSAQADPRLLQLTRVLDRMSIVIIRIRNSGSYDIGPEDFADDLSFTFGRRTVWDARVSEASSDDLREQVRRNLEFVPSVDSPAEQTDSRENLNTVRNWLARRLLKQLGAEQPAAVDPDPQWQEVRLTRLSLHRREKFKLVVLLREPDDTAHGTITKNIQRRGRFHKDGRIKDEGEERAITWQRATLSVAVLLMGALIATLLLGSSGRGDSAQCSAGSLQIDGSSAFMPTVDVIARKYQNTCGDTKIATKPTGSLAGIAELNSQSQAGELAVVSDGEVHAAGAQPHPVAVIVYGIVVNSAAGVDELTSDQLRAIYTGQITNWKDVGGRDMGIRIVSRDEDSGTRWTFQNKLLSGAQEAPHSSLQCDQRDLAPQAPTIRCVSTTTEDLLAKVNATPGAIGYADAATAKETAKQRKLNVIRINGKDPDVSNALRPGPGGTDLGYPFWTIEYFYTQGSPIGRSMTNSFLDYLGSDPARAELRRAGYAPCVDKPDLC